MKNNSLLRFFQSTLILISLFVFQGCYDLNKIKIGVLFPLTGDAASYGDKGIMDLIIELDQARNRSIAKTVENMQLIACRKMILLH
ncbi:MAG: hypothetical protein WCN92_09655 [Eubacteriales bacterium]